MRAPAIVLLVTIAWPLPASARQSGFSPDQVRALLDAGEVEAAVQTLEQRLRQAPNDSGALLLRSTARLMQGDLDATRADLERALGIDPTLREGWLNLGAVRLAVGDHDGAVAAFLEAEELDPSASDNSLNIGAAMLLKGDREGASRRFRRYLTANAQNADAFYLVAANYAMADRKDLVLPLLRRAVELDERTRLRARSDPNFAGLSTDVAFRQLLETDSYQLPKDALVVTRSYGYPYTGRDSPVLGAVLSALQLGGTPFDSGVEVTSSWALLWSEFRIKVAAAGDGRTDITFSAPGGSFSREVWRAKTEALFRRIAVQLHSIGQPRQRRPEPANTP